MSEPDQIELAAGIKIDRQVWAEGIATLLTRAVEGALGMRDAADPVERLLADIIVAQNQLTKQSQCD